MRTIVVIGLALVHVDAFLRVRFIDDGAGVAVAQIPTFRQITAPLLTAAFAGGMILTLAGIVAAPFIGAVATVIVQVANLRVGDALVVRALELVEQTLNRLRSTNRHVVLVTRIRTLFATVAQLIARYTLAVVTLELVDFITGKIVAHVGRLVRIVATVVNLVAQIGFLHAQMIGTLESVGGTVATARVTRRTIQLVRQITAIFVAVAFQLFLNAMAGRALEPVGGTRVVPTIRFVAAVATIVVMVALPTGRYAFVVAALELGF